MAAKTGVNLKVPEGTLRVVIIGVQVLLVLWEVWFVGVLGAFIFLPYTLVLALGSFVVLVQMRDRLAMSLWRKMKNLIGES